MCGGNATLKPRQRDNRFYPAPLIFQGVASPAHEAENLLSEISDVPELTRKEEAALSRSSSSAKPLRVADVSSAVPSLFMEAAECKRDNQFINVSHMRGNVAML